MDESWVQMCHKTVFGNFFPKWLSPETKYRQIQKLCNVSALVMAAEFKQTTRLRAQRVDFKQTTNTPPTTRKSPTYMFSTKFYRFSLNFQSPLL